MQPTTTDYTSYMLQNNYKFVNLFKSTNHPFMDTEQTMIAVKTEKCYTVTDIQNSTEKEPYLMKQYSLERLMEIALALSSEKNIHNLLQRILEEAMDITNCDAGVVYTSRDHVLHSHQTVIRSKQIRFVSADEDYLFPSVPMEKSHVCAYAALFHKKINIPDIDSCDRFSFTMTHAFDRLHDYRTISMLIIPMEDERRKNIGVLELINATDEDGKIIPFDPACESLVSALASLAAVSITNRRLSKSVLDLLHSLVAVLVDTIDARMPYNANHTRSMVRYAERFMDWLDLKNHPLRFSEQQKDPFLMSVWLHDIGKLVVPSEIIDKPTRLGSLEQPLMHKIDIAILMERLHAAAENRDFTEQEKRLEEARKTIRRINTVSCLTNQLLDDITALEKITCYTMNDERIPLLSPAEAEALRVKKGTLTAQERLEIQKHVVYTSRLLANVQFHDDYEKVPVWAGMHHELLDGSGYPDHKAGNALPLAVRLLTIFDIYDALTAEDRPYRPPVKPEEAFAILGEMRDEGKIDGRLLRLFKDSRAWQH